MQKNAINSGTYKILTGILANTYILFTKVRNYHVNFIWWDFVEKHTLLWDWKDSLYWEIDTIAEQIRKCWGISPMSMDDFKTMWIIKEATAKLVTSPEVMNDLYNDLCVLDAWITKSLPLLNDDLITQNMLIEIRTSHDKIKWFIRSIQWQV